MRSQEEVECLLGERNQKRLERILGIQIRNGQTTQGVRAALRFVLEDGVSVGVSACTPDRHYGK